MNDGSVYDPDGIPVENILPDTLRLELYEGERAVLHVDVLPENATERSLSWSAPNRGIIKLTPDGATCSVLGLREGEETIEIRADGGAFRCVAVSVRREPILSAQSIYYDTEADVSENVNPVCGAPAAFAVKFLLIAGASITVAATCVLLLGKLI